MDFHQPTYYRADRTAIGPFRVRRARLIGFLVVVAAAALGAATIGHQPSSSTASVLKALPHAEGLRVEDLAVPGGQDRSLGEAGGAVPARTTVFDDQVAGVANLDPDLSAALRRAANDASNAGIALYVDSGWRSPQYQQHLLDEAIAKYGSAAEASRWVAAPNKSAHVSGDAVDVGPAAAATWLSEHGSAYGLCRIYGNEPWHYELRAGAADRGCPALYADPSQDPRLQP